MNPSLHSGHWSYEPAVFGAPGHDHRAYVEATTPRRMYAPHGPNPHMSEYDARYHGMPYSPYTSTSSYRDMPPTGFGSERHAQYQRNGAESSSQFTPSCTRCRGKKLKCVFEPGTDMCTNCISKGMHECKRDLRVPRGKKGLAKGALPSSSSQAHRPGIKTIQQDLEALAGKPGHDRQTLLAAAELVARVEAVPSMRSASEWSTDPATQSEEASEHSIRSRDPTMHAPSLRFNPERKRSHDAMSPSRDFAAQDASHARRPRMDVGRLCSSTPSVPIIASDRDRMKSEERDAADVLNTLASSASVSRHRFVKRSSDNEPCSRSTDTTTTLSSIPRSQKDSGARDRQASLRHLISNAKATPMMDNPEAIAALARIYRVRLNHTIGSVIFSPAFCRVLDYFIASSVDELMDSDLTSDPACLSVILMVLCIGWEAYPVNPAPSEPKSAAFDAINEARQSGVDPSQQWFRIAREALAIEETYQLKSIAALQAACLMLSYGKADPHWQGMVEPLAIKNAQHLGLHRLGKAACQPHMDPLTFIKLEIGVRIWNYLCLRDWCSVAPGCEGNLTYMIHPEHCTTRRPLNLSDEDLEEGMSQSKPMDVWTPMSYGIVQLDLADIVREGMDLCRAEERRAIERDETLLPNSSNAVRPDEISTSSTEEIQGRLARFVANMPAHFSPDSAVTNPPIILLLRWQLCHQIFDLLAGLSRRTLASSILTSTPTRDTSLGSSIEPPGIMGRRFARAIITQHGFLRKLCPVVDSMTVNYTHMYSACIVALIDLISRQLQKPSCFSKPPTQHERNALRKELQDAIAMLAEIRSEGSPSLTAAQNVSPAACHAEGDATENPLLHAHKNGIKILNGLLAFEHEVASAPVAMYTLDNPAIEAQRRELSDMARQICFDSNPITSARIARVDHPDGEESANAKWPALLLPAEKRREIPQKTMLPIVGAWQTAKDDRGSAGKRSSQDLLRKNSWPEVHRRRDSDALEDREKPHPLCEDDRVACTVTDWAQALSRRPPAPLHTMSSGNDYSMERFVPASKLGLHHEKPSFVASLAPMTSDTSSQRAHCGISGVKLPPFSTMELPPESVRRRPPSPPPSKGSRGDLYAARLGSSMIEWTPASSNTWEGRSQKVEQPSLPRHERTTHASTWRFVP